MSLGELRCLARVSRLLSRVVHRDEVFTLAVRKGVWNWLAWGLGGLVVALVGAVVVVRLFVGWFSVIPQNGMYPGLPSGSWVFGRYHPYADVSQVARGDIIMFERTEKGQRYIYIWRVVGLPGETVTIDGDTVIVNGKEVEREKLRTESELVIYRELCGDAAYEVALGPALPPDIPRSVKVAIPRDQLFVMGDNRHRAVDSRTFGPIPFSSIVAKKW
jgi:signal peptidase I